MGLKLFNAPPLPNPPPEYDPIYIRQLIRVIEIYHTQLDSKTPNIAQSYEADAFYGGELNGYFKNVTTVEKNAMAAVKGQVVYDTTLNKLCVYTGAWETITSV